MIIYSLLGDLGQERFHRRFSQTPSQFHSDGYSDSELWEELASVEAERSCS